MPRKSSAAHQVTLTDDDMAILDWIARFSYMTSPQIARVLGRSLRPIYTRITKLEEAGLLRKVAWMIHRPSLIVPTSRGITAAGYVNHQDGRNRPDLAVPQVKPSMVPHTIWISDLAVTYYLMGHRVISEREISRLEVRGRRPEDYLHPLQYAAWHDPDRAAPYVPDLVVVPNDPANPYGAHQPNRRPGFLSPQEPFTTLSSEPIVDPDTDYTYTWADIVPLIPSAGLPVAIEVELSQKPYRNYLDLVTKYQRTGHLAGTVWFTHKPSIANALTRAATDAGSTDDRHRVAELVPWQEGMEAVL
ncbi:hypothetical protein BIV57_08155 [Mangrovactinospora gilvigrisea]|uniref:Uncharacterized protein n=1 Tax=Mangrovactinospora gilvigrisea TaxID=1428644 RepID=A0A1J7BH38_9ACTN|nr:winged helix-turn-helix domain-containing protein [Mangrovactinospora gilvigrisea]OIV37999.1 hypothetical protein BIV57_08155 [Mangrovactinospora gilvigrisea]